MSVEPHRGRWWRVDPRLFVMMVGLIVYRNSVTGPFIFDDHQTITNNPFIRHLWPLWTALSAPQGSCVSGRPIISLSLALNYACGGLHVVGYHLFNIVAHLLAALLLYGIVRRTLCETRLAARYGDAAEGLALASALIWVVHPLLTESVNFILQRSEVLMGFFLLLTLYCVIRGAGSLHQQRWWYAAAVVTCALGMASKEVMVSAPLLVWFYDRTVLARSVREMWRARRGLYAGLASTWVLLAVLVATHPHPAEAGFGFAQLTPWRYAITQCGVIAHYLRLAVWPSPLVVDYMDWPVPRTLFAVLPSALAMLGLVAATCWALLRRSPWGLLGAWFLLILAPTSSMLPIVTEIAAERRMYLPLAAVVVCIVMIAWHGLARLRLDAMVRRRVAIGLVAAAVGVLGALTVRRNHDYRTEASIWSDAVAKRPNNARAHNNLGQAWHREGRLDAAVAQYHEALRLKPDLAQAHYNLGLAMADERHLPEAVSCYLEAIRLKPKYAAAHYNLALVLDDQERFPEAIAQYLEAIHLEPTFMEAYNNLAVVYVKEGRLDEAVAQYREALRLAPDAADVHYNLGRALVRQERFDDAVVQYREALRLQPGLAAAQRELDEALTKAHHRLSPQSS